MPSLSLTFYRPLFDFLSCLVSSFPTDVQLQQHYGQLKNNIDTESKTVLGELGPHITKDLLSLFLRQDVAFFDNPFVDYIGGVRIYNMLDAQEQNEYWGPVLENIIRQGIVVYALFPKMDTLENLAHNLLKSNNGQSTQNPLSLMKHVMNDPNAMTDIMSLVDGKNGVKDLMGMLKSIVHGVSETGTSTSQRFSDDGNVPEESGLFGGGHTSTEAAEDIHANDNPFDTEDATPSSILREQHRKRSAGEKSAKAATGIDGMCRLIDDVTDDQLDTMQTDINDMTPEDMQDMMNEVCGMLQNTNTDNPLEALSTLAGVAQGL